MPFNIGLSGLNAASADLRVTGNNIANAGTTGFKNSRAEFGDVFSQSYATISKTAIGSGVRLLSVSQLFGQGTIEFTQNGLDLAINGEGFFVLKDTDGSRVYSRAGEFQVDRDGYLVNNTGQNLQGFSPIDTGDINTEFNTGELNDIQIVTGDSPPQATSDIEALVNLRSDAEPPPIEFEWPEDGETRPDPDMYNFSTSVTLYDSLGTPRTLTMYFVRGEDPLEWEMYAGMENTDGVMENASEEEPNTLTFDANGVLVDVNGEEIPGGTILIDFPGGEFEDNGALQMNAALDFRGTTQYGEAYSVNELTQNGYTTGRLAGVDIDESGVVFARFTNGQSQVLAQLALGNFTNPQGLTQLGDNNWAEAFAAGDPLFGAPATGDLGQIQSGGLESSNVDLAGELVNLITAQRNFQANAQTIQTADAITQTIINIR